MITNFLIANFLICRQRAYMALTNPTDNLSEFEFHQQQLKKHIMEQFYNTHQNNIIQGCNIDSLCLSNFVNLSNPVYIINPLLTSENEQLTLDAIKILPPSSGASKLSYIPIKASSNVRVSKNDKLELCITACL